MVFHLPEEDIQLLDLPISEVNRSNSTKGSGELTEFCFYCMDIFDHKFDDINVFAGVISYKVFSCQLKRS